MSFLKRLQKVEIPHWLRFERWDGYKLTVAAIILASILAQRIWLNINQRPPELVDDSDHLWASMVLYKTLTHHGFLNFIRQFLHTTSHFFHPPLIPALTTPFYLLLGLTLRNALWFNTASLIFFFIFLFRLFKQRFGETQAVVAVALTALFPLTYGLSRAYLLEFGLATIVVIWLYYFCESDCLANKRYLPILSLLFGVGWLTKATFIVYIIGPILWEFYRRARVGADFNLRIRATRLVLLGCVGGLLALPWYWNNILNLWAGIEAMSGRQNQVGIIAALLSWPSFKQFVELFLREGISIYFVTMGIVLLIMIGVRRQWSIRHGAGFLIAWFIPPFIAFALLEEKIHRYLFPALPSIAGLLSLGLARVLPVSPVRRALALALLMLIPVGNFIQLSFFDVWTRLPAAMLHGDRLGILENSAGIAFTFRAKREPWPLETILEVIQDNTAKRPGKPIHGIMRFWLGPLWRTNLLFLAATKDIALTMDETIYDKKPVATWLSDNVSAEMDYEFLVIEQPVITLSELDNKPEVTYEPAMELPPDSIVNWFKLEDVLSTKAGLYKKTATIALPESTGAEVVIYRRDSGTVQVPDIDKK